MHPFVRVNMAVTADGKIDTIARQGVRISGPADGARVDGLRAEADAILVGGRTMVDEDPRLTVRDAHLIEQRESDGRASQPTKIGVATRIEVPGGPDALPDPSRFLSAGSGRVLIFTTTSTAPRTIELLDRMGADVIVHTTAQVDLVSLVESLPGRGIEHLMVEGGSTIVAALLAAGLVDEFQFSIAPIIFGGEAAPTLVGGPGFSAAGAVHLSLAETTTSDDGDIIARYRVKAA